MVAKAAEEQALGRARPFVIREQPARGRGRGRGMGRVRGARATRATTEAAAESDHSNTAAATDADSEAEQSEQSQGQHSGVTDSTMVWPHSADVPSSRDFASDRVSHWTE